MLPEREFAVCFLDLLVGGAARHAEDLVVVALHQTQRALTRARARAPLLSAPRPRKRDGRLLLDFLELGLDDVLLPLALRGGPVPARRLTTGLRPPLSLGGLGVHRLGELVRGASERVGGAANLLQVLRVERLLGVGERTLDVALRAGVERGAVLGER